VVAVAGCSSVISCRAFAGDRYGVIAGISVISAAYANSAKSDTGPPAANSDTRPPVPTNSDAGTTDASAANTGTASGYPDAGTTYSTGTTTFPYADDVADTGDATGPDFHLTAPSPTADATAGLRIQPADRKLGQVLGYNRGDARLSLAVLWGCSPAAGAGGSTFLGDQGATCTP
jgi:hypothetical protein